EARDRVKLVPAESGALGHISQWRRSSRAERASNKTQRSARRAGDADGAYPDPPPRTPRRRTQGPRHQRGRAARQIEVPVKRITEIMNGQRGVTADTALRLGHWFGTSPEYWLNLQKLYELRLARAELGDRIEGSRRCPARRPCPRARCLFFESASRFSLLVAHDLSENRYPLFGIMR